MIGKLFGHTQVQTTGRYAHLERHSVKVAAVRISDSLEADRHGHAAGCCRRPVIFTFQQSQRETSTLK